MACQEERVHDSGISNVCQHTSCVAWRGRAVTRRGVAWRGVTWRGVALRCVALRGAAWRGRAVAWPCCDAA